LRVVVVSKKAHFCGDIDEEICRHNFKVFFPLLALCVYVCSHAKRELVRFRSLHCALAPKVSLSLSEFNDINLPKKLSLIFVLLPTVYHIKNNAPEQGSEKKKT
jgi:hypothetical protein